jgi:homoserine acetyltransferase
MTRGQLGLLDHLGVEKLYASIGSSMGGMGSLSMAYMAPERVGRVVSISATGRSGLGGVGMRYAQRSGRSGDIPAISVLTNYSTHGGPELEQRLLLRWYTPS